MLQGFFMQYSFNRCPWAGDRANGKACPCSMPY